MKKTISLMIMACMLLLAACDNYLDIQPTGSVIPNSLAEYTGRCLPVLIRT